MRVDIETRVRRANPLVQFEQLEQLYGDDATRRLRSVIYARTEGRMTETSQEPKAQGGPASKPPTETRIRRLGRRQGLVVASASFIVILVAGALIALASRDPKPPVASPTPDSVEPPSEVAEPPVPPEEPSVAEPPPTAIAAEEVARTFIEVSTPEEASAAVALIAADADVDIGGLADPADAMAWFGWLQAIGWEQTMNGCQNLSTDEFLCRYTFDNPWMTALEVAPVAGSTFTFTIEDGLIVKLRERLVFDDFGPVWEEFKAWVLRTHPGGTSLIMTDDEDPILTPEAIALWETYSSEFIASVDLQALGEQFIDAYLSYDPDEISALADPDADLSVVLYLQGWAHAANYEVTERRTCNARITTVTCVLGGLDDWGNALGLEFVDTFVIESTERNGILNVSWQPENSPADVAEAFEAWIRSAHPELFAEGGACESFFENGPTPGDCALAWVDRTAAYNDTDANQ